MSIYKTLAQKTSLVASVFVLYSINYVALNDLAFSCLAYELLP